MININKREINVEFALTEKVGGVSLEGSFKYVEGIGDVLSFNVDAKTEERGFIGNAYLVNGVMQYNTRQVTGEEFAAIREGADLALADVKASIKVEEC